MHNFRTLLLSNWERIFSVIYSDELVSSIVLQSGLNDINVNSETNAVFNLLKVFCFCSVYYHETLLINLVESAVISIKDLMNC